MTASSGRRWSRGPTTCAPMPEGPTLAQLGEGELIRRLGAFAPPGQFDDDAALLGAARPRQKMATGVPRQLMLQ